MPFQPNPGDELSIDGAAYRVAEHPSAPGMPYGQEGRAGIVYQLIAASYNRQWGGVIIEATFDVSVYAENPVDANNIDALITTALDEAVLVMDEQDSMLCRRVSDLPTGPDIDSEGKRIYQVGGSYSVWAHQSL